MQLAVKSGLSHGQAVWRIIRVIKSARRWLGDSDPAVDCWLSELEEATWAIGRSRQPPDTTRKRDDNGGRTT